VCWVRFAADISEAVDILDQLKVEFGDAPAQKGVHVTADIGRVARAQFRIRERIQFDIARHLNQDAADIAARLCKHVGAIAGKRLDTGLPQRPKTVLHRGCPLIVALVDPDIGEGDGDVAVIGGAGGRGLQQRRHQ
jgi:hypothetical protein